VLVLILPDFNIITVSNRSYQVRDFKENYKCVKSIPTEKGYIYSSLIFLPNGYLAASVENKIPRFNNNDDNAASILIIDYKNDFKCIKYKRHGFFYVGVVS
jgi:hypothetical protein